MSLSTFKLLHIENTIASRELNTLKWKAPSGKDEVLKLKEEMSGKWFMIGSTVGLSDAKLKGFRQARMNISEDCMNEVIRVWIQKMSVEVIMYDFMLLG